jgi:hypothetical protein
MRHNTPDRDEEGLPIPPGAAAYTKPEQSCWTCGRYMFNDVWRVAPREPSDENKRMCLACHNEISFGVRDPLWVMNMIRYAAGVPIVPQWWGETDV